MKYSSKNTYQLNSVKCPWDDKGFVGQKSGTSAENENGTLKIGHPLPTKRKGMLVFSLKLKSS